MSEAKHTSYDLAQMQSLPLEAKIVMTQNRIREWYEHWNGMVYVSFSGGKDSTVLKHIVDGMYDDVPALFVNTGLEYPEIQKFAMSQKNVVTVRPELRFDEVLKTYGYPVITKAVAKKIDAAQRGLKWANKYLNNEAVNKGGNPSRFNCAKWKYLIDSPFKVSSVCCDVMKKKPIKKYNRNSGRKPFIATLAEESICRKSAWFKTGCNAFNMSNPSSKPISFWTEQDILHYLKKFNVPYCCVYGDIVIDEIGNAEFIDGQINAIDYRGGYEPEDKLKTTGCSRTGCIFCMFGCHLEKEPNRFQRLKKTHPRQYEYCIGGGEMVDGKWQPSKEGLGLGKVLDYIGVRYE